MPSSSPHRENRLTLAQPHVGGSSVASNKTALPPLRQPTRIYPKNTIVRAKHSRVTLAQSRRRRREYPEEDTSQDTFSTASGAKTCVLRLSTPVCGQDAVVTTQTAKLNASERREEAVGPADGDDSSHTNSCFLCLQNGGRKYTVLVKFAWPGRPILRKGKSVGRKSKKSTMNTAEIPFTTKEFRREGTQTQVMQAIQDAIYQHSGSWKRWLWCYEIRTADEIKVSRVRCMKNTY